MLPFIIRKAACMVARGLEHDAWKKLQHQHQRLTLSLPNIHSFIIDTYTELLLAFLRSMAPIGNKSTHKGKAVLAGGLAGAFEICWYVCRAWVGWWVGVGGCVHLEKLPREK